MIGSSAAEPRGVHEDFIITRHYRELPHVTPTVTRPAVLLPAAPGTYNFRYHAQLTFTFSHLADALIQSDVL